MRFKYDRKADAAYLSFYPDGAPRKAASTYACDPSEVNGQIHLDFDEDGVLIGLEVLDASRLLPEEVLVGSE